MSAILQTNTDKRLTTSYSFSKVPGVTAWSTLDIIPSPHSNGAASVKSTSTISRRARNIKREEPCFITKSVSYTHERAYWVNALRKNSAVKAKVENLLDERGIVAGNFKLNDVANLTHMDRSLHAALDRYAFFAVTGSLHTLDKLIEMLEEDNRCRQETFDKLTRTPSRMLNLFEPPVSDAQYELVVLRPNHFLPDESVLTTYDRVNGRVSTKTYMIAPDGTLRRVPVDDINASERFPTFAFDYNRRADDRLNPFLVILNAEIKFRRLLRENPRPGLPDDVMELINKTIYLVELIYWDPVPRPNTRAWTIWEPMEVDDDPKAPQSGDTDMGEFGMRGDDEDDDPTLRQRDGHNIRGRQHASLTLEERRDIGQNLLSGHDLPDSDSEDEFSSSDESDDREVSDPVPVAAKIQSWQQTLETAPVH